MRSERSRSSSGSGSGSTAATATSSSASFSWSRLLAVLVMLLCLPVIYFSIRWGMADINAYPVQYAIDRWETTPNKTVELAELEKAEGEIDAALSWSPDNAQYLELKARLLLYRAYSDNDMSDDEFYDYIDQALVLHQAAIEQRPRWPYSWANQALMLAYLGEVGDEFELSLKNAGLYGPWELSVNLTALEAGLLQWPELSPQMIELVVAAAERATQQRWRAVEVLLDRHDLRLTFCGLMKPSPNQEKICKVDDVAPFAPFEAK